MIEQMRAMCSDIGYHQTAAAVLQRSNFGWAHTGTSRTAATASMDPFQRDVGGLQNPSLDDDAFLQAFEGVHGRAAREEEAAALMAVSAPSMSQVRDSPAGNPRSLPL